MSTSVFGVGNILTLCAVALFAVTGVPAGLREGSDIFSLVTFGVISAIGGGTIQDMILNIIVWTVDHTYIWVAIAASMFAFVVYLHAFHTHRLLLYMETCRDQAHRLISYAHYACNGRRLGQDLGFEAPSQEFRRRDSRPGWGAARPRETHVVLCLGDARTELVDNHHQLYRMRGVFALRIHGLRAAAAHFGQPGDLGDGLHPDRRAVFLHRRLSHVAGDEPRTIVGARSNEICCVASSGSVVRSSLVGAVAGLSPRR